MQQFKDNEILQMMYDLADGQPYNPQKWWTCTPTFEPSFQTADKEFVIDGQWKQIKVHFVFD